MISILPKTINNPLLTLDVVRERWDTRFLPLLQNGAEHAKSRIEFAVAQESISSAPHLIYVIYGLMNHCNANGAAALVAHGGDLGSDVQVDEALAPLRGFATEGGTERREL